MSCFTASPLLLFVTALPSGQFILEVDASENGVEAVLSKQV